MDHSKQRLREGCLELSLNLSAEVLTKIHEYFRELAKWNRVYNLVSTDSLREWVTRHALDCLSIVPHLAGKRLVDIGSGAGLPGLMVALACPDKELILVDSREKRAVFLQHIVSQLSLPNISVVCTRMENYRSISLIDGVIARAFGSLEAVVELSLPVIGKQGIIYAMEGKLKPDLYATIPYPVEIIPLKVPGLMAERHLLKVSLEKQVG